MDKTVVFYDYANRLVNYNVYFNKYFVYFKTYYKRFKNYFDYLYKDKDYFNKLEKCFKSDIFLD